MVGESSSTALMNRLTTSQDSQTALQFAFFNTLLFFLTGICLCGVFALYKMMYMFLSPMMWAVLVGTVLFPFKKKVTDTVQGWLGKLQQKNQTLAVGLLTMPFCRFCDFSEFVYTTAMSRTGLQVVIAYIVLKLLTYERTFVYMISCAGRVYNMIDTFILFFSKAWVFPLILIYFCAYAGWIYVQQPGSVNKKVARALSLPIWVYALSFMSFYFGVFRAAVFGASAAVLGALSAGAWVMDNGSSPSAENGDEVKLIKEEEPAESKPPEEDTASVVSIDKALGSDKLILIIAGLCALSWIVRHDSALLIIIIPFIFAAFGRLGSNSGVFSAIGNALSSLWERLHPHVKKLVDVTVAGSLRQFVKVLFTSDQMLVSSLYSKMDVLSSVVVMLLLAFSAISGLIFVGFQLHSETVHIARLASNIVNSRPDWLGAAMNFTEDQLEDHHIDIDDYVEQAYQQGRAWLASNVRTLADPKDTARADMLESQVKQIVDNIYKMWEQRNAAQPESTTTEVRADWKTQLMSVTDLHALKDEVTLIVKENMDTLMNVASSVWSIVAVNMSFILSLVGAFAGLILDFGMDIINLIIEIMVFLTMVYYLLSASRDRWLPIEWVNNLAEVASTSEAPSPSRSAVQSKSPMAEYDLTGAIEQAIFGVFVLSSKMAVFYGLYTYFVHTLFDLNVVFVPCMLAAIFAAIPIMPPYIVCIFGVFELWLVRGELSAAIVFAVMSFAPQMFADATFYREVKFSHPYVTGLAIIGGMYWLGLQGAIIGPIILCSFLVLINVFSHYARPKGEKTKSA
ncbi:hypothetical protein Y032_0609g617 [Ancylostoma ceylanicum]|uniref:Transmembrane protein 245 n=1 Tax=Ancylostoma ceylanicum TaxID=53326 RepID=A0A016WLP8_9BILA|nr:hypothetical protein Y032_0609g617 [Ancylostoma ceylanicum]